MDVWQGYATPGGTARFSLGGLGFTAAPGHFRKHGGAGGEALTLGSIGLGSYLGNADDETDTLVVNAVIRSAAEGVNVIDSAANYRGGRGEVAVGRALHALRTTSGIERDQLFISTKAGFAGGTEGWSPLLASGAISGGDVTAGVHCMHPACLRASLEESLLRLSISTVDLL